MSIFAGVTFDNDIKVQEDRVPGGSGKLDKTGKYDFIIKKAYIETASSGAMSFVLHLETESGQSLRVQEYFTNKSKETFYLDKDGNKQFLPGFNKMKTLDYLITKKDNPNPNAEEKTILLWDNDLKKEVPTKKHVLVDWFGKPITALVMNVLENKQEKDASGVYKPIADTRNSMVVDHFLDPVTLRTRNETTVGGNADICAKWTEKFKDDYVRDARTIKDGAATSAPVQSVNQATADAIFG